MREHSRSIAVFPTADSAKNPEGVCSVFVVEHIAKSLTDRTLAPRRDVLCGRAPKDPAAKQTRRDVGDGKSKPWHMLARIAKADIEDGIPAELVAGPYRLMAEMIDAMASERRQPALYAPSILPLIQRENRMQAVSDAEERDVLAAQGTNNAQLEVAEIDELLAAWAAQATEIDRATAALQERRARLTLEGAR